MDTISPAVTRGARGRRRPAGSPLKKATYQMHSSTIEGIRRAVESGAAPSQNAFVEEAVIARLRELRRAKVYAAYEEATQDPVFLADMHGLMADFDAALLDGLSE